MKIKVLILAIMTISWSYAQKSFKKMVESNNGELDFSAITNYNK